MCIRDSIAMVFSSIPHGYVVSVDATEALKLSGVYGVFHYYNTPEYLSLIHI